MLTFINKFFDLYLDIFGIVVKQIEKQYDPHYLKNEVTAWTADMLARTNNPKTTGLTHRLVYLEAFLLGRPYLLWHRYRCRVATVYHRVKRAYLK